MKAQKCIRQTCLLSDGAWAVGMEFLAQLHLETKWDLRGEFPELVAKLGELDEEKFPTSFKYCLDVKRGAAPRRNPNVKPSKKLLND